MIPAWEYRRARLYTGDCLAALRLGMGYVGIEKQADQVAASIARLRGAASQTNIFDAEEDAS